MLFFNQMSLPKIVKRYFPLFLLVFFLIGLLTAKSVSAREIPYDGWGGSPSLYWFKEALKEKEQNLESFVGGKELLPELEEGTLKQKPSGIMPGVVNSLTAMIIGLPLTEEEISAGYVPSTGAVGGVSNLIAAMYANPPASGVQYLADLGRNLGIVTPAYAQAGVGFRGLSPILPIWKAFRNIAYLFFVIIFVVIGFAIMFRVKISPQAVITIQSALPRIIMALILVTFSFAIAGFLIDLMYIVLMLGIAVLGSPGLLPDAPALQKQFLTGGFPQLIGAVFKVAPWGMFAEIGALVGAALGFLIMPEIFSKITGSLIGALAGASLFGLIIAAILLFALFKLLIELIKAYINIILAVIFAPFQIALDTLPGQSGFKNWLQNLIANLAVFPAVAIWILIARLLTSTLDVEKLWTPPMMIGGLAITAAGLIGFGMILLLPKVAEMVKEALKVKPLPYGAAIGEAMGPMKETGKGVFYLGAGEVVGPEGFLERAGKPGIAMAGRKILRMK